MSKSKSFPLLLSYLISSLLLTTNTSASTINNNIKINTNTGGNTVDQDNSTVTTGDTNVSISVKNNTEQTTTNSQESISNTTLDIQAEGGDTTQVQVTVNNAKYEVETVDGQTKLTTTKSDGSTETRQLENGETLRVTFEDNTKVAVTHEGSLMRLTHNNSSIVSQLPLSVDIESEEVSVQTDDSEQTLTLLPADLETYILEQRLLDSRTDEILLIDDNNTLAYQIPGQKSKKLLGIFEASIHQTLTVPVEHPEATTTQYASAWDRMVNWLSF